MSFYRKTAVLLTALVASVVGGVVISPADAAEIPGAITDVDIEQTSAGFYQNLTVNLDWCVPNEAREGDTFWLQLPDSLRSTRRSFTIDNAQGETLANAVYDPDTNRLTFTLTDVGDELNNVCGTAFFTVETDKSLIDGGEPNDFHFETNTDSFDDTVDIGERPTTPPGRDTPFKTGRWFEGDEDSGRLIWQVETTTGPWANARMVDRVGPGQAIDCDTIVVGAGPVGDYRTPAAVGRFTVVSCSATELVTTFRNAADGEGFQVKYQSEVTDLTLDSYTNSVQFEIDGRTWTRTDNVDRTDAGGEGEGGVSPAIDIEKWSTADGYPAGDFDTAPGKELTLGADEPITMTITNTGDERLRDVVVTDQTDAGPALRNLTCDFSPLGGPATGTTWVGPYLPGTSFECTATLPALRAGQGHSDTATVLGVGRRTGTTVTDNDPWHGHVAAEPDIDIEKWSTVDGFPAGDFDDAPGKPLDPNASEPISMTITNSGTEALVDVLVSDATLEGPALRDLTCDFSALGGPATGTTWDGPFEPGDTFGCTATLPGMPANGEHSDEASVSGAGQFSGEPVEDKDEWHGHVPPKPEVDIEKWNTEDGQIVGDFDDAPGKPLDAGTPTPISMTITNTGNEPLVDVVVSDATQEGPALRGLSCDFSPLGGPAGGVRWAGPFEVGDSFVCTATLPAMNGGETHADEATVDGTGQFSGEPVEDKDPWHGHVPPKPDIDIEKWNTEDGPDNGDFDDAPGLEIEPSQPTPITMTITNTGNEPLVNVKVSDRTNEGLALQGLSCDFSALGGPASGTTWKGPFQPGDSFDCTATLPAMDLEEIHSDTGQVDGAGQYSGEVVDDKDDWHGHTPGGEVLPRVEGVLPNTGGPMIGLTVLGSLLSVLGALVLLRRRQQG